MANQLDLWRGSWMNPFRELRRMQSSMEKLFDEMSPFPRTAQIEFSPSVDILEDKSHYVLKFDMPGIQRDQIRIELNNNVLTVSAERKEEQKQDDKRQYLSEVFYGSYQRSFTLPTSVDEKKVDAKLQDGVLTITIPKSQGAEAKQIAVH